MPRKEDYSDSDSDLEGGEEGYTSVHLGIPSDIIDVEDDIHDPYVSRIGGTPAFLSYPHPSLDASKCKNCGSNCELLVQMLCNLEDNPFERVLYVWGCSKASCQKKDGSIRVWRALKLDEKYAKKLERKRQRKQEQDEAKKVASTTSSNPSVNPFSSAGNPFSSGGNPFSSGNPFSGDSASGGFGDSVAFGGEPTTQKGSEPSKDEESEDDDDDSEEDSDEGQLQVEQVTSKLEKTAIGPSVDWSKQPHFMPYYLETESEYLPPPPKVKPANTKVESGGGGGEWSKELWEETKLRGIDDVFVGFTARIEPTPKQCIRYELNGTPLFYQNDKVYELFSSSSSVGNPTAVTGSAFIVNKADPKKKYNSSASRALPQCPICSSPRRFEAQLMPNLINKLKHTKGKAKEKDDGMEWGTVLIFTCEKNCCEVEGVELKECWREEATFVQWEE